MVPAATCPVRRRGRPRHTREVTPMSTSDGASRPGLSVNGTMPGWAERAEEQPAPRVHRLLPARRRAGLLHEQPGHRARDPGGDVRRRAVARLRGRARPGGLDAVGDRDRDGPRSDPRRAVRLQRRARRRRDVAFPPARLGCAGHGLDRARGVLLDDPARRAGGRVHRRLEGAAVHAGVQLHHADLPDRRAELRQRPRPGRWPDRPGRRPGHGRPGRATRCAPPPTPRRRTTSRASSTRSSAASASCSSPTA